MKHLAIYISTEGEIVEAHMYPDSRPHDCYIFVGFAKAYEGGIEDARKDAQSQLAQALLELAN